MKRNGRRSALAAAFLSALSANAAGADGLNVLHQERSLYRNIAIYEDEGLRCMTFGRNTLSRQSCISLAKPDELVFNYARMVMGALYMTPAPPKRILILGLGGGSLTMAFQRLFPGASIDAVEIDPAVVRMARRYFEFKPADETRIYEEDGRVFVKRMQRRGTKYDLVILDAYDHEYIPEHMLTVEFLLEVKALLGDRGVVAGNTFSNSKLYDHESATYFSAFGDFYRLKSNNRVILARIGGLPSATEIARNADALDGKLRPIGVDKAWVLPLIDVERGWPADTRVLTDQYSPSNLLNSSR